MAAGPNDKLSGQSVPSKLITGTFADDGTAQKLIKALKEEKGIITANMFQCRGVGAMDKPGRHGRLPPAISVRVLTVVVPAERADELFDYICDEADIDRPDGGFIYQSALHSETAFSLPEEAREEKRADSARRSGGDRRSKKRDTDERRSETDRRATKSA